jgi:hypothetical protein
MMTQQLRRWTDKVDGDMLRRWSDKAGDGVHTAYDKAMNHPKATAAVLLGTGVAAALLWVVKRNGASPSAARTAAAGEGRRRRRVLRTRSSRK